MYEDVSQGVDSGTGGAQVEDVLHGVVTTDVE
jgi:hypothetical protein